MACRGEAGVGGLDGRHHDRPTAIRVATPYVARISMMTRRW